MNKSNKLHQPEKTAAIDGPAQNEDLYDKMIDAEDQLKNFTLELQRSNEALRKSEERYHKMIAEVQDYAIILLDTEGHIQNWNTGAEKIKGYTAEEIIGKSFQLFYPEEDRRNKLPQQLLARAAAEGKAQHEGWRMTKQGTKFWGSIVITALHDDEGVVMGFSKVTRDLTEKKIAEDKLNEYLRELQKQNEELDRFAYAASHDLQEPLRKIQTFADLIEQSLDNREIAQKYVEKIARASERMSSLIDSILEYSRLSKSSLEKTPADLNRVLEDVLGDLELIIQQKKAMVVSEQLPIIQGMPLQIGQLFTNLISNALKYNDKQPEVSITSRLVMAEAIVQCPDLAAGQYYQLAFTDNGIGFDPQYAELIFSLFQRLHGKHKYSGTGIGLALCKKIMENHDGCIFAEGAPGKGASFYLIFPAIK
jgi:PAS domain S-box-containing protein